MVDIIKHSFRNIWRKKFRTFLTIAGISIGVLSVVIISIIGDIGKYAINHELYSLGIGGLAISANSNVTGVAINAEQLETIKSAEEVAQMMPLVVEYTDVVLRNYLISCIVWGIDDNAKNVVSMELLYGRLLNKNDIASYAKVCVVDEKFALYTYKRSNIIGKKLDILMDGGYESFEIVGIVASGGNILQNIMGEIIPNFIYVPQSTAKQYFSKSGYDEVIVELKEGSEADKVASKLSSALSSGQAMSNSFRIENLAKQKEKMNSILDIISYILSAIAAISLIVSGLSIMTIMLVSVHERTREIGIKKSIGAKRSIIMTEFMIESFFISLIGSLVGAATGILLALAGCFIMNMRFILNVEMLAFCISFTVLIGVVFGVYPARKAATLKPVDALRYE